MVEEYAKQGANMKQAARRAELAAFITHVSCLAYALTLEMKMMFPLNRG
jgi:hypothetical protein